MTKKAKINKFLLLIYLSVLNTFTIKAQTTSMVLFDNFISETDNDLKNNFTGTYTFRQLSYGGITGGAIETSENYCRSCNSSDLESLAIFKDTLNARYRNIQVSLSFKHTVSTDSDYPTVAIVVRDVHPDKKSSEKDYLMAFVAYEPFFGTNKHLIGINTNFNGNIGSQFYPTNDLKSGYWYRMSLTITETKSQIKIEDLGPLGISTPVIIHSLSGGGFSLDNINKTIIGIVGNKDGGCRYIDNFSVTGATLSDGNIKQIDSSTLITMPTMVYNELSVSLLKDELIHFNLYDVVGKNCANGSFKKSTIINIQDLAPGQYFIVFNNSNFKLARKFVKLF